MKQNEKIHEKRDLDAAKNVTELKEQLFWPSTGSLQKYIKSGMINCESTIQDVATRNLVYRKPAPLFQVNNIKQSPVRHARMVMPSTRTSTAEIVLCLLCRTFHFLG